MKLVEIIKSNSWLSIEMTLLKLYPDQFESIEAYKKVFDRLQELDVEENEIEIVIEQEYDEETRELGIGNVYGIDKNSTDKYTNSLALEFTQWKKWLGMIISELTEREFTELEIISHCLYEMTYVGYEEDEIQSELSKLEKTMEEYKNLTSEDKKLRTKSLDDISNQCEKE